MKKFCFFYIIYTPILLLLSYATWGSEYSAMVQIVAFFFTGILSLIVQLCIRDHFLKEVKSISYEVYQSMSNLSSTQKIYDINIDPNYQYSSDIQKLLSWLRFYSWCTLGVVLLSFILAFLATT